MSTQPKKISAEIVADSKGPFGDRITTMLVTFPRFILAELNTHRMLSKNSASSRAIPFKKMLKMVQDDPFIPIAWQKDHTGMQGTEYLSDKDLITRLTTKDSPISSTATSQKAWLLAIERAIEIATVLSEIGVTKQLCNRVLEPFMWHTVLITATEWENFFHLRCPKYYIPDIEDNPDLNNVYFKSKKDLVDALNRTTYGNYEGSIEQFKNMSIVEQLQYNKGQAEIHMMALAEAIWDAMNESIPRDLDAGEWHIPFGDKIDLVRLFNEGANNKWPGLEDTYEVEIPYDPDPSSFHRRYLEPEVIKIATARCARTSYLNFDGGDDYESDLELYNSLLIRPYTTKRGIILSADDPIHASPAEHCAKAMDGEEYDISVKGNLNLYQYPDQKVKGWCRNFRGFIQHRALIEA